MKLANSRQDKHAPRADSGATERQIHDLLAEGELLDVRRQDLESFDSSTFDAEDVTVPPDVADPKHVAHYFDDSFKPEEGTSVKGSGDVPMLFSGCDRLDLEPVPESAQAENRFADLVPLVIQAYVDVRQGWSTDFLVAEPELNVRFLQRCWELGAAAAPQDLNWTLLTARKDGHLQGLPRARAFSIPRERMDLFAFASEMALRHLQDRAYFDEQRELSLDKVLCEPALAAEFDATARKLAPGYSSLEYRWAAISLRKARRWAAEVRMPGFSDLGLAHNLRMSRLPTKAGLFWFQVEDHSTFVGVAENLRVQIDQYLTAIGPKAIPEWWVRCQPTRTARLFVAEMPRTNPGQREKYRSLVLRRRASQLNFLNG